MSLFGCYAVSFVDERTIWVQTCEVCGGDGLYRYDCGAVSSERSCRRCGGRCLLPVEEANWEARLEAAWS